MGLAEAAAPAPKPHYPPCFCSSLPRVSTSPAPNAAASVPWQTLTVAFLLIASHGSPTTDLSSSEIQRPDRSTCVLYTSLLFARIDSRRRRQNLSEKIISTHNAPYRFLTLCYSFMFILLILLKQIYLLSLSHASGRVGLSYYSASQTVLSSV